MGQKVNPVGMRVGLNKNWNSRWYASDKDYSRFLAEDIKIREFLEKKIGRDSQLSHIEIERKKNDKGYFVRVIVFVAKPGTVIGQKGENINKLTDYEKDCLIKGLKLRGYSEDSIKLLFK